MGWRSIRTTCDRVEGVAARFGGEEADFDALGERRLRLRAASVDVVLLRLDRHRDVPLSVGAPDGGRLGDLQVVEGDALEEVGDQVLLFGRPGLGAQGRDEVESSGGTARP